MTILGEQLLKDFLETHHIGRVDDDAEPLPPADPHGVAQDTFNESDFRRDAKGRFAPGVLHAAAEKIKAIPDHIREDTEIGDFPAGGAGYNLYEARKLMPKPTEKLKRVTDGNSFSLWQDYDYIANVDGVHYGVTKQPDPDADEDEDEDKPQFVYAFEPLHAPHAGRTTDWSDVESLMKEIRLDATKQAHDGFVESEHPRDRIGEFALKGNAGAAAVNLPPDTDAPTKSLFDRISQPDGGFTYQPHTHESPVSGYALSPYPERSFATDAQTFSFDDFVKFAVKNNDLMQQPDHFIGGWNDPQSHKVYLDVSIVSQDPKVAERLALQHDQIAYFDLAAGKSIDVNRNATSGGATLQ